MTEHAGSDQKQKLWNVIKDIRFAMLTTDDGEHLRSRPMAASQQEFDGNLWFFTRASSPKAREVNACHRVNVSYADPAGQNYVSLSGHGAIVQDRAEIEAHWSEAVRVWFPQGKTDPDLALLKVEVDTAEYWDSPSSMMVPAYGYAKAVLTGASPRPGVNEKVTLG